MARVPSAGDQFGVEIRTEEEIRQLRLRRSTSGATFVSTTPNEGWFDDGNEFGAWVSGGIVHWTGSLLWAAPAELDSPDDYRYEAVSVFDQYLDSTGDTEFTHAAMPAELRPKQNMWIVQHSDARNDSRGIGGFTIESFVTTLGNWYVLECYVGVRNTYPVTTTGDTVGTFGMPLSKHLIMDGVSWAVA